VARINSILTRARRLSLPTTILALAASFVAIGGTATAATMITGWDIKNGTVTGLDVKESSLSKVPNADKLDGLDASKLVPGGVVPKGVTIRGTYGISYPATGAQDEGVDSLSFGASLTFAPDATVIASGEAPTAQCPGSWSNPMAAPGQLCVYERLTGNAGERIVMGATANQTGRADRFGAVVSIRSLQAGTTWSVGTWAVTAP